MNTNDEIISYANINFDVVGVTQLSGEENLLILGLESKPERNLDEFGYVNGKFHLFGYENHISRRLESVLDCIRGLGYTAAPVGKYGYPLNGELYLKGEIIRSGLGKRGKNTVILHPRFGNRLRFSTVVTNAPLTPLVKPVLFEEENPVCKDCSVCINACPEKILEPYRMIDSSRCRSDTTNMTRKNNLLIPCDLCLKLCPASKNSSK